MTQRKGSVGKVRGRRKEKEEGKGEGKRRRLKKEEKKEVEEKGIKGKKVELEVSEIIEYMSSK